MKNINEEKSPMLTRFGKLLPIVVIMVTLFGSTFNSNVAFAKDNNDKVTIDSGDNTVSSEEVKQSSENSSTADSSKDSKVTESTESSKTEESTNDNDAQANAPNTELPKISGQVISSNVYNDYLNAMLARQKDTDFGLELNIYGMLTSENALKVPSLSNKIQFMTPTNYVQSSLIKALANQENRAINDDTGVITYETGDLAGLSLAILNSTTNKMDSKDTKYQQFVTIGLINNSGEVITVDPSLIKAITGNVTTTSTSLGMFGSDNVYRIGNDRNNTLNIGPEGVAEFRLEFITAEKDFTIDQLVIGNTHSEIKLDVKKESKSSSNAVEALSNKTAKDVEISEANLVTGYDVKSGQINEYEVVTPFSTRASGEYPVIITEAGTSLVQVDGQTQNLYTLFMAVQDGSGNWVADRSRPVYCMDHGKEYQISGSYNTESTTELDVSQANKLYLMRIIMAWLGYDPSIMSDQVTTSVYSGLVWLVTGTASSISSNDETCKDLIEAAQLCYQAIALVPSFSTGNVDGLGYTVGYNGESPLTVGSGLSFDKPTREITSKYGMQLRNNLQDSMINTSVGSIEAHNKGVGLFLPGDAQLIGTLSGDQFQLKLEAIDRARANLGVDRETLMYQITTYGRNHYFVVPKSKDNSFSEYSNYDGLFTITNPPVYPGYSADNNIATVKVAPGKEAQINQINKSLGSDEWTLVVLPTSTGMEFGTMDNIAVTVYTPTVNIQTGESTAHWQRTVAVPYEGNVKLIASTPTFKVKGTMNIKFKKQLTIGGKETTDASILSAIDLKTAQYGLYKDGKLMKWSDEELSNVELKTGTKASETDVIISPDAKGDIRLNDLFVGEYTFKEIKAPDGTELDVVDHPVSQESMDDNSDVSVTSKDELSKFGFSVEKSITMTGSQQEGVTKVPQDSAFSSGAEAELAKSKVDLTKAVFELQTQDGKPVKSKSAVTTSFDKTKDVPVGKYVEHENVRFSPDANGKLEVHNLIGLTSEYQLVEVATPDRTNIDSLKVKINRKAPVSTSGNWKGEHFDTIAKTNGFKNNIDYTGVKLVKDMTYLDTNISDFVGQATRAGSKYTLFYGDGDKANQPVNREDAVASQMRVGTSNGETTSVTATGPIVFEVQSKGLVAVLDNLVYGSYYILETSSAPGLHLDKVKYYFGDKPSKMDKNDKYLEPKEANKGKEDTSTSKESEGKTTDAVKLISVELEKRTKYLNTDSPFQESTQASWDSGTKDVTYKHGDVRVDYIGEGTPYGDDKLTDLGSTTRNKAIYGLFYLNDTLDGEGKANQPVKLSDKAVKHMKVTKGKQVDKDYETVTGYKIEGTKNVVLQLDDVSKLGLENIAYGGYYLKEIEAPAGLAIDTKEYIFGAGKDDSPTHVGNGTDNTISKPEVQSPTEISKTDDGKNYHFDNTFANGPYGSTDVILTFGFSSMKVQDTTAADNDNIGENGVKMVLTPIDGTKGYPIETVTSRQKVKDNSGKIVTVDGFYEFRTIPIGTWLLTSETGSEKLEEITPIIAKLFREKDGSYTLEFYLDENKNSKIDDDDVLLSSYSKEAGDSVPDQSQLNAVNGGSDTVKDGYGEGKNGSDVYEGEDHVWQRDDNKDVNSDGSKNNNFISAEINIDYAGFDTIDKFKPDEPNGPIKTKAVNEIDGGKYVSADVKQTIVDTIDISQLKNAKDGDILTVNKTIPVLPYAEGLVDDQTPIDFADLNPEDVKGLTLVLDAKGNKAIALPSESAKVLRTADQEGEGLTDLQFVYKKGMKEVKVQVSGIDLSEYKSGQKVVMFESLIDKDLVPTIHADVNDEDQTVTIKPSIGTQFFRILNQSDDVTSIANDDLSLDKTYAPNSTVKGIDYVKVTGAKIGVPTYFIAKLQTVDKDGKTVPLIDSKTGNPVEGRSEVITPTKQNFIVPVYLEFTAPSVDVKKIVAFEYGYENDQPNEDMVHEDIEDEEQTITPKIPEIRTKATVNGEKTFTPSKETPMHDDIEIKNATPGSNLDMLIKLWRRTPTKDGKYKDEVVFESKEDIVVETDNDLKAIETIVDTSKDKEGTYYVWTEELYDKDGNLLAKHDDLENKDQTVTPIVKTPEIRTKATVNGEKTFTPSTETPMHDDIQVTNGSTVGNADMLIKLWRRTPTGDGKYKDEIVFESKEDIVVQTDDEMFAIDTIVDTSKDVVGTYYVWTEELYDKDGNLLAKHEDLESKDQSVTPKIPEIRTKATVDGQKTFQPSTETPMHDDVEILNASTVGNSSMLIKLWRMKPNGNGGYDSELVFEDSKDLVVNTDNYQDAIDTVVDTSKDVKGTYYVWTEELYDKDGNLLAEHNDLTSKDQSVTIEIPDGPTNTFSNTGTKAPKNAKVIGVTMVMLVASVGGYIIFKNRKSTNIK